MEGEEAVKGEKKKRKKKKEKGIIASRRTRETEIPLCQRTKKGGRKGERKEKP